MRVFIDGGRAELWQPRHIEGSVRAITIVRREGEAGALKIWVWQLRVFTRFLVRSLSFHH